MGKLGNRIVLFIAVLYMVTMLVGCREENNLKSTYSISQFENSMKDKGYKFEIKDVEQSFIPTARKRMIIDDNAIDIYLFNNDKEMENEASHIDNDGFCYDNGSKSVIVCWIASPHFYKEGSLIVKYIGEDKKIISDLKDILGGEFAGDKQDQDINAIEQIRETQLNPVENSKQTTGYSEVDVLSQLANQEFFIQGENLCNADDKTIVEFGKAFVNLYNGAVANQEKVSFEKYISNENLLKFTDKMLELTQKQDLQGKNIINYGLKNEFEQVELKHIQDNLCYMGVPFKFKGSGMRGSLLITSENKSLKLVDLYFGSKDGVDTFSTGHHSIRKVDNPNLWNDKEWVRVVFDKLEDFEERH